MDALTQVNEIKVLAFMLLLRLGQLSPATVVPRLDDIVTPLREVMKDVEVKDDTVKQDLERKGQLYLGPALLQLTTIQRRCNARLCAQLYRCSRCRRLNRHPTTMPLLPRC